MEYSMFMVDEVPYCIWEWDLKRRNIEFLNKIDHEYFRFIAESQVSHFEGEHAHRSALLLRTSYHQALETFFMLLFAALQAPDCAVGYVQFVKSGQIRNMIRKVNSPAGTITNKQGIGKMSWQDISKMTNIFSYEDKSRIEETQRLFGVLWSRFAHEYTNDAAIKEYNSIKHGFRVQPGGFTLSVGAEPEYGVSPPSEEMVTVGGSRFGTSFFSAEKIDGVDEKKYDCNLRVRQFSINWNPDNMAHALAMLSMSINNIITYMKIVNGVDARTVPFFRPVESEFFEEPFKRSVGVPNMSFDLQMSRANIRPVTREDIKKAFAS